MSKPSCLSIYTTSSESSTIITKAPLEQEDVNVSEQRNNEAVRSGSKTNQNVAM